MVGKISCVGKLGCMYCMERQQKFSTRSKAENPSFYWACQKWLVLQTCEIGLKGWLEFQETENKDMTFQ